MATTTSAGGLPPASPPWPRWREVRAHSLTLAAPLSAEDQAVQSMPDASPTKWHLAHTTWFFETWCCSRICRDIASSTAAFAALFNSYYESLGPRHPRPQRGMLTRPPASEVRAWRVQVDAALARMLDAADREACAQFLPVFELGLHHEQQHQELMLTDILHAMSLNPLRPAVYGEESPHAPAAAAGWIGHDGGVVEMGHGGTGFAFDNEGPRHRVLLEPFQLAQRLVTNAEYQAFIDDGGYRSASLWLSDGRTLALEQGWDAPLYWLPDGLEFTLHGVQPRRPDAPVRHLSFYEAAAYAQWAGARLPLEAEWEAVVAEPTAPAQAFGAVWQWTRSSYDPYPRYRAPAGAVGEYNGKFMVGQMVLRGSSSATPAGHARVTYRNFFPPAARWQFSGVRLARDA